MNESECCERPIFQADPSGAGHCSKCGEHCAPPKTEETEDENEYMQQMADRLSGGR